MDYVDDEEWASEPIAIIGMSCKFSGGASSPAKLWDLMASGRTGWSEIPKDRFDLKGVYHPNHERTSTSHVKGGHFLDEDVAAFDAAFFNYSAEMAQVVDPQFRLQLESTYEALENAGLPLSKVMGTQTSVFAGVFTHDYQDQIIRDEDRLPRFNVVGTWSPMSSNRISHFYDFRGASMTLETGCSTTLVALHQAIQTLRNREADMSMVTGSNVMLNPDTFKAIGSLGMLSPDGRSWAFDSRANGYGRGEGVATVIVKRLSDALAANDPIRAVIRETALNQDGKTDTITTPSGSAQVDLMRECYRRAGLDPRGTQYFEAHGTGTPTGDPIEASAMAAIFANSEGREREANYLHIGSVKTNVGHTEAASGLAAIIKGVLCLEKELLPPSVNLETPNPKLKLDEWRLKIVRELQSWPKSLVDGPNRLSVNNFGYGGANAHVIMESADPWTSTPELDFGDTNDHDNDEETDAAKVLVLSARDERGCQQMVSDLREYLKNHESLDHEASKALLSNLSYTLGERRTLFQWVAAYQVRLNNHGTLDAAIQALDTPRFKPARRPANSPRIGMIFTGQGAQWYAMGRELLSSYPIFRQSIDEAEAHLRAFGAKWSLIEELNRDKATTKVHTTNISIPICVALQIALVQLLESWGIQPTAVTSHSSGEISAAYAVGALTHRQAMAAAYWRAVLAADESKRPSGAPAGAMAAVGLGAEAAKSYIDKVSDSNGKAVIACVNSPQSVTVSGDSSAVQEIEDMCKKDGVFARKLKVQQAYHSHHMDHFAEAYREHLRLEMFKDANKQQAPKELKAIFSSAVTGSRMTNLKDIAHPDHWVGSLVGAVEFVDAFTDMVLGDLDDPSGRSVDVLLEVGPHTALGGPIREILSLAEFEGIELPYWGALVRDEHAGDSMRSAACNLFREGLPLNMSEINFPVSACDDEGPRVLTDLPSYPWNHTMRHWQEARVNRAIRERSQPPHELLGMPVAGNDPSMAVWRRVMRVSETPWIRDHMVQGAIVYPGAGSICLAIEAAKQLEVQKSEASQHISGFRLRDIKFLFALVVPDNADGVEIRTMLRPVPEREIGASGWQRFEISTVTLENRWTVHAQGLIKVEREAICPENLAERSPISTYTRHPDPQDLFANLRARGVYHGPLFQNTTKITQDGKEPRSICDITIQSEASSDTDPVLAANDTLIHPITLDAVVVSFYSTLPSVGALQQDPKLPSSIASLWLSSDISHEIGHTLRCDTLLQHDDAQSGSVDINVLDPQTDATVLKMQGLQCSSLGRGSGATARQDAANKGTTITSKWEQDLCGKLVWNTDLSLQQPQALEFIKKQLISAQSGVTGSEDIVKGLERACFYFAHDALQAVSKEDVSQPYLVKYYEWLIEMVNKANSNWARDSIEERQNCIVDVASQSFDGELICRLGPLLAKILRSDLPMKEVTEMLHEYNARSLRQEPALGQFSTLLRTLAHKNPEAKVLQIGDGSGVHVTRRLLEALGTPRMPLVGSWHVTEPNSEALDEARTQLADWADLLAFDQLDIDRSPSKQKFDLASYDIVIAPQVLHATSDVAQATANIHSLLKPGGTLLLGETTSGQIDTDFVFGLLPGGLVSQASSWDDLLVGTGFTGVDLKVGNSESDVLHSSTIIMSTVPIAEDQRPDLNRVKGQEEFAVVTTSMTPPPAGVVDLLSHSIQACVGTRPEHLILEKSSRDAYKNKICVFIGEIEESILVNLDTVRMEGIRSMVTQCNGLLWVTKGGAVDSKTPEQALSQGFLRVLRNEYVGRRYISLDLDPTPEASVSSQGKDIVVATIVKVLEEAFGRAGSAEAAPAEFEYAERNGVLLIPRVYKDEQYNNMVTGLTVPTWSAASQSKDKNAGDDSPVGIPLEPYFQENRPLRLEVGIPGHLDTMAFVDDMKHNGDLAPEQVEIAAHAYGLCSRDTLAAMGQLKDRSMGLECAGVLRSVGSEAKSQGYNVGDRVMALLPSSNFASHARVSWQSVVPIPDGMDFNTASSLPLAYTIAYHGLINAARLVAGQSVFIHAAAGSLGQAAIMLAKHLGVTDIYCTAGSQQKRKLLQDEYGIPEERIFNSRDTSFASSILATTKGRGVDVVLNSLPGPFLQATLETIAPLGHLIQVSKEEQETNRLVALESFSRGVSFVTIDIPMLLRSRGPDVHRVLGEVSRLVNEEKLKPVQPVDVHSMKDIQGAFQFVQTGAQIGKVVISAGPGEQAPVVPRPKGVTPSHRLRPDASYLIIGGLGGIGRSIAYWLFRQGAKNIILMSRSASDLDLEKNKNTEGALFINELRAEGCRVMPVSCDISIASSLVKALHACEMEGLPPVRGIVQGAMLLRDAIFEQMTLDDWQSGLRPKYNGTFNLHTEFSEPGSLDFFVMLSSVSGVLGIASQANYAAGGSYEDALARWRQSQSLPAVSIDLGPISDVGYVSKEAKVAERLRKEGDFAMLDEDIVLRALSAALADASSHQEAASLIGATIASKLADIFMTPVAEIDLAQPPAFFGVDSLIAVELRNLLVLQAAADISIFDILQTGSLAALATTVAEKSRHLKIAT
ncbi:putative polyketide synthase [Aaosphaeria arxii CBS 175.79]|uniref:Putative polyketide synthase n=1 Tax=Aaosphaeria arxii CBS 175.79 TaxID=1450172 RepID=A0A6A5Y1V0_9PLEO|nr:putative polyketide synthase [Aaosphaeria arxii CBS 175.79]KAF2019472.1 putative polyketide synthase [Aaosphaeria arxii CBS 175.79]